MKHLQTIKDKRQKHKGQLATITYETLRYLENTPCGQQTEKSVAECLEQLKPFGLSKTEKLMIINNPPTTALEIQLMIEESEERLTEDQVKQILDIVVKNFPHVRRVTEAEEEEDPE